MKQLPVNDLADAVEERHERRWYRDWSRRWSSNRVDDEADRSEPAYGRDSAHEILDFYVYEGPSMTGLPGRPRRARLGHVERLMQALSERDWAIIETVHRLRVVSGPQLEYIHFFYLSSRSRSVMRWRVLKRLVDARVLTTFERRIGTARRGSDRLCFCLDSAGLRLIRLRRRADASADRVRRPRVPGERFLEHTLAVSQLYVDLVVRSRDERCVLESFQAEPDSWVKDGLGGWLKPDAYLKVRAGAITDYWWAEVDRATESLPTVRRQLLAYLDFVARGQLGPDGIYPRVLIGVPSDKRLGEVQAIVDELPDPAQVMFSVTLLSNMAGVLIQELTQW